MNKILEFLQANKYVVIWTIAYIAIMWLILFGMFDFNMFSPHQWNHLFHAELRGFAGFVFGILLLAALPLYISTTTIIVRTKAPLFTIPIPKIISKLFAAPPAPVADTPDAPDTPDTQPSAPEQQPLPSGLPNELRGAFMRARAHICPVAVSAFNTQPTQQPNLQPEPVPELQPVDNLPLPSDFDIGDEFTPDESTMETPVFTEINFDEPAPDAPTHSTPDINSLSAEISTLNRPAVTDGNIVISNDIAIAMHDDADFWIADTENWFAAGKQKPSPIAELLSVSATHGVRPVLYLKQSNIMDLDTLRTGWHDQGITVITDLSELPATDTNK